MKPGDSVVVRRGVMCPDRGDLALAGWQGRVIAIEKNDDSPTVDIEWDSQTIRAMPDEYIRESEVEGLDWSRMWLGTDQVEAAPPRDTPAEARKAMEQMAARHAWNHLEEEGTRIGQVLAGIHPEDSEACAKAWAAHLNAVLTLPFHAEVTEYQERGPLQSGDRVRVDRIRGADGHYGVIVQIQGRGRTLEFPLCDLEAVDKRSPNYQPVNDYAVWFANR